jgi:hypothetical protein
VEHAGGEDQAAHQAGAAKRGPQERGEAAGHGP